MLNTKLSVCDPFQKADTRFLPNLCILDATPDTVINIGTWECSRFFNLDQILSGKQLSWSCFKNPYLQYALESPMSSNLQAFSEQSSENECVCVNVFNPCSPSAPVGVLDPSSCHAWEGCWVSTPIHSSFLSCPWKATAGGTGMSGVACPVRPLVKIFMTPKATEWPENQIAITPTKHTVDMGH